MAEVQAGQDDAQGEEQQQNQDGGEQEQKPRNYTQAEWDARQLEFNSKADKIRKNAARDAELKLRRESGGPRQQEQQEEKPKPDPEPKRDDFPDYETFLRAVGRWEGRQGQREETSKAKEEADKKAEQDREAATAREFKKRADAAIKDIPDFVETIENAEDVMITKAMGREIQESEFGPRILYELVKNPDEAARIAALPVNAQIRAIGKMEARLEAGAKKPDKKGDDEGSDEDDESKDDDVQADDDADAAGKGDEADDKGKEAGRNTDGTFKPQKKRPAPDPIEPGGGRRADTGSLPSDKDDIDTWMRKEAAREKREGRR